MPPTSVGPTSVGSASLLGKSVPVPKSFGKVLSKRCFRCLAKSWQIFQHSMDLYVKLPTINYYSYVIIACLLSLYAACTH